jgi:hypothetical protein
VIRAAYTISSYLEGTGANLRLPLNPPFTTEFNTTYTGALPGSSFGQGLTVLSSPSDPFAGAVIRLSKSAEEYSIHSVSLDGDEFGIVGVSPTINSSHNECANADRSDLTFILFLFFRAFYVPGLFLRVTMPAQDGRYAGARGRICHVGSASRGSVYSNSRWSSSPRLSSSGCSSRRGSGFQRAYAW